MTLISEGTVANITMTQLHCDVCDERFAVPSDIDPLESCPTCSTRKLVTELKQKVTDAQVAGLQLLRAVLKHQYETKKDYDPTEHDRELWEWIAKLDIPNDSPSGIVAVIQGRKKK